MIISKPEEMYHYYNMKCLVWGTYAASITNSYQLYKEKAVISNSYL